MKILLADNDITCRDLLSEMLRRRSYEVAAATNGREALEMLDRAEFQILISEWVMPEINGPTLCKAIRSQARAEYLFIILLTSRDAVEDVEEGLSAGADEFMIKPFSPGEVLARIHTAERILALEPMDFLPVAVDGRRPKARDDTTAPDALTCVRFPYFAKQWAAPCAADGAPDIGDFVSIECRELDRNGIRFQCADPRESGQWVVALDGAERTLFVLSRVDRRQMALDDVGRRAQILDCSFLRRVHVNAHRWSRALRAKRATDAPAATAAARLAITCDDETVAALHPLAPECCSSIVCSTNCPEVSMSS